MMRGINRDKLKILHPNVAKVLDNIYDTNKKNHYWFFVNYNGKYKTPSGTSRTVSLGAIIDVLNDNGYEVDLTIRESVKP